MWDIFTALLGRWSCPWCTQRQVKAYRWFYNHLPHRVHLWINDSGYDDWIFRVGGGWHRRHHVPNEPDYDPCEGR